MVEIVVEDRFISEPLRKMRDDVEFNIHQLQAFVRCRRLDTCEELLLAGNLHSQLERLTGVEDVIDGWEALRLLNEIETNEEIFCRLITNEDNNPLVWNPFSKD